MTTSEVRSSFLELVARPDDEIDLAVAALLIAKEEYPSMVVDEYLTRLGGLAEMLRPRLSGLQNNPFAMIDGLNGYLFGEVGFRGNQEEYFDARNSFLNVVLDRKRGIPITLSLVYMEVAARLGFPLEGVGFPGHFLVRHIGAGREILIDPFHAGEILLPDDCRRRLKAAHKADVPLTPRFFQAMTRKQILSRMLNNLKHIYMKANDHGRVVSVADRMIALAPDEPAHLRDRGIAHLQLDHYGQAMDDFEAYLKIAPMGGDLPEIRKRIRAIHRLTAMLN